MQIQISWLRKKPTDLDLHCLQMQGISGFSRAIYIVLLSLLIMTNRNQMCEVVLFVCSKMADETNLSSKLPVVDRTREVWGRKLYWWCLSSGFPLRMFLLDRGSFLLRINQHPLLWGLHFARSCAICSHDSVGMLKSLREALRVSWYRFF